MTQQTPLKALADAVLARNGVRNRPATVGATFDPQKTPHKLRPLTYSSFRGTTPQKEVGDLDAILVEACHGVEGIDPATFRSLLSPEDLEDIDGGFIPVITLNAYARSFAEGIRTGRLRVIPRAALPKRVCCADCLHFERDTIGDGTGIGCCKIDGEGTGPRHPALWANAERACRDFTHG